MSDAEIEKITDSAGTGAPNFTYGLNSGGSDSGLLGFAYTASDTEPSSPANGDVWFDTANDKYYTYINGEFKQLTHINAPTAEWTGARGFHMGGRQGVGSTASSNKIDYFVIATTGNSADFGDLIYYDIYLGAANSNKTRVVEYNNPSGIQYITCATTGNALDFGDLTVNRDSGVAGGSNGTIGLIAGGFGGGYSNIIDRLTIATTGNTTDHGDLTVGAFNIAGTGGETNAIFGGRQDGSGARNTIDYVGIATAANATDFGDLLAANRGHAALADLTRTVFGGGSASTSGGAFNVIQYVTSATTGNATDFGDLTAAKAWISGASDGTYGVFTGGNTDVGTTRTNAIDRITIQTTGNASDHGDLQEYRDSGSASSGNAS